MSSEFAIYRRFPGNIESQQLATLACGKERKNMFPTLSAAATQILLLPIGTAGVERTFSTMNRILCSQRCRLLPHHVNDLMKISIEGPQIPNILSYSNEKSNDKSSDTSTQHHMYNRCIDEAHSEWLKKPRRNI